MPSLLALPVIELATKLLYTVVWALLFCYVISNGELKAKG